MSAQDSFLFNLPEPIVAIICCDWLTMADVSRLDSACLAASSRCFILEAMKCGIMKGNCTYSDNFEHFMKWVSLRQLRIDFLIIPRRAYPWEGSTMITFLTNVGRYLLDLNIDNLSADTTYYFSDISFYCAHLRALRIRDCKASSGSIRSVLMNCLQLEVCELGNFDRFPSHCLDGLQLTKLHTLHLQSCDRYICEVLGVAAPNLRFFSCWGGWYLSPGNVKKLCEGCPQLIEVGFRKSLNPLDECLDPACVIALATHCARLQALNVGYNSNLPDSCFAARCSTLRKLCIHFICSITHESLLHIADNCPLLEVLGCEGCPLTDEGLVSVKGKFPRLNTLYIGSYNGYATAGYIAALSGLPALRELGLYEVSADNDLLGAITAGCPRLRHLELQYCRNYTSEGVLGIAPHLATLTMTANGCLGELYQQLENTCPGVRMMVTAERGFSCGF